MKRNKRVLAVLRAMLICFTVMFVTLHLWAADDETELAKKTQNPVADLISIPIQSNFNFNYGANRDKSQIVTNIQPVVPISLNEDWNLIARTIVPFGLGAGKIFKIGKVPFNANVQAFYNAVRPTVGPDWSVRGQIALLLPKSVF